MRRRVGSDGLTAWFFILASLVGFAFFYVIPAVRNVIISFTHWNMLSPARPAGLANYAQMFGDSVFWNALKITFFYVIYNIPLQTVLAIFLAVMMDRFAGSVVIRGVLILPYLLPPVVVGLIWLWMLNPILGIVDVTLKSIGLPSMPFLGSVSQALPTIAGINIWEYMGFNALLFFAGLQGIPKSLYEAAGLDGASEWTMLWRITLPLLRPVTAFVVITTVIGSFQIFDTIAVTTTGGPVNATRVLVWYIYEQAFQQFKMGYGASMATFLFVLLGIIALIQFRVFRTGDSDLA
ncbi:MAG TPA: sugar ABC transporter permease [Spirochaetia bacterium]|nr:sugar ABC transporter permease [Spirochaetia bacterium]